MTVNLEREFRVQDDPKPLDVGLGSEGFRAEVDLEFGGDLGLVAMGE